MLMCMEGFYIKTFHTKGEVSQYYRIYPILRYFYELGIIDIYIITWTRYIPYTIYYYLYITWTICITWTIYITYTIYYLYIIYTIYILLILSILPILYTIYIHSSTIHISNHSSFRFIHPLFFPLLSFLPLLLLSLLSFLSTSTLPLIGSRENFDIDVLPFSFFFTVFRALFFSKKPCF